ERSLRDAPFFCARVAEGLATKGATTIAPMEVRRNVRLENASLRHVLDTAASRNTMKNAEVQNVPLRFSVFSTRQVLLQIYGMVLIKKRK
ncbi:MAG: hypothetical protein MJZ33_12540, partial [Paludibacteraceae bacterium]|nr:hypothetical protein [Paludibacteraceae bacterium]